MLHIFKNLYNHAKFKEKNNILCMKEQDISISPKLLNTYEQRKVQIFNQIKLFLKADFTSSKIMNMLTWIYLDLNSCSYNY